KPSLYKKIKGHPLLSDIFLKKTEELGMIEGKQAVIWKGKERERLEAALTQSRLKADHATSEKSGINEPAAAAAIQPSYSHRPVQTAIGSAMLDEIMQALTTVPKDFRVLPKVRRTLLE